MLNKLLLLLSLSVLNGLFTLAEKALFLGYITKGKRRIDGGNKWQEKLRITTRLEADLKVSVYLLRTLTIAFFATCSYLWFGEAILVVFINSFYPSGSISANFQALAYFSVLIVVALVTCIMVFAGQLMPYVFSEKSQDWLNVLSIRVLIFFSYVFFPFVKAVAAPYNSFLKALRDNSKIEPDDILEEEIRNLVDSTQEPGAITESGMEMLNNVFEFDDKIVGDIATHRRDIVALEINSTFDEIADVVINQKYSRIPVYEENIDNIVGILHTKDLLSHIIENKSFLTFNLSSLLHKPYFLPISKKTNELFQEMQTNKTHIAIILDEYGGTEGLVTMEDLVEEVMGSILDEYDEEETPDIQEIGENVYRINGAADLELVAERLQTELPTDDYDTLGGFIIGKLGRFPAEGEKPEIVHNNFVYKADNTEDKRIISVLVSRV